MSINTIEYYLPSQVEDSGALKAFNPDWDTDEIERASGIKNRYIAEPELTTVDMAECAAGKLFESGVDPRHMDFLILVTQSPDYPLPASACVLQQRLDLKLNCMAFDVNLGCSGYVYGLAIAGGLIAAGLAEQGLLLCGDTFSRFVDIRDRSCRPLFGDAAAATHLVRDERGLVGPFEMGTDGKGASNLIVKAGGFRQRKGEERDRKLYMHGSNVFLFALDKVPSCIRDLLQKADYTLDDIDLFVFHQASRITVEHIAQRLRLPMEKVFTNYQRVGNTVSTTIPIALKDAVSAGRLRKGDRVVIAGYGVGYSWGACVIEWESET